MNIVQNTDEKKVKTISVGVFLLLAVLLILIFAFIYLTHEVLLEKEKHFDAVEYSFFQSRTTPELTNAVNYLTFFGSTNFLLPAYIFLCVFYFVFKKNSRLSWNIIAVGLTSTAVLHLMKNIFRRPRPEHTLTDNFHGFSYPSGHSFSSFTFAGIVIYILWQSKLAITWKVIITILLVLFAASVALSRVYLHVHYASDVLAGFILSVIWLIISFSLLNQLNKDKIPVDNNLS